MAASELIDSVEFTAGGLLRIKHGGQTIQLRRPKIGELSALTEAWQEIVQWSKPADGEEAEPEPRTDEEVWGKVIAWYRQAITTLGDHPEHLPDDDGELPSWMRSADVARELLSEGGWRGTPWVAGARPSERLASAQTDQLAGLATVVPQLTELARLAPQIKEMAATANGSPAGR